MGSYHVVRTEDGQVETAPWADPEGGEFCVLGPLATSSD